MKILLLGDINSAHVQRWAIGLSSKGMKIGLWSLAKAKEDWYTKHHIEVFGQERAGGGKFAYFFAHKDAEKALKEFQPQILHSHYASSYGMIGRKLNFHPFCISVWGSDITHFPHGAFRRSIMRKNLAAADAVFATSKFLSQILEVIWNKKNTIIPFGIDTDRFHPGKVRNHFTQKEVVIGTVKALETIYGIDATIAAFGMMKRRRPDIPARLLIAGDGSMRRALMRQVQSDGIENFVKFIGKVPHQNVPDVHREIDVFVNLSHYESFGVSVLEASSCEKPVIVSNVGGLKEVVTDNYTGYLVEPMMIKKVSELMEKLAENESLRNQLGVRGREYVESTYNWEKNLDEMIAEYQKLISR